MSMKITTSRAHCLIGAVLCSAACVASATEYDHLPAKVKAAFREVAAQPAKSTVRIYGDHYQTALGVVVDPSGYIVTKASELKGKIECQVAGGKKQQATIVGRDADLDLALLKIDATDLPVVAWSEGDPPPVGSWLVSPGIEGKPVGVGILSVSPRRIRHPPGALGVKLDAEQPGATIEHIFPQSAAEKAGLKVGDVILKINGKDIPSFEVLSKTIQEYHAGDKVDLVIRRGDKESTLSVVLGVYAQTFSHGNDRAEFQNSLGGDLSERRAGFPLAIQHDSMLRPSDCGGPIVDLDGKAVGLNIARAGRVESFALPATVVREAVKKLLETHQTSAAAAVER
jgi:serine protease Do